MLFLPSVPDVKYGYPIYNRGGLPVALSGTTVEVAPFYVVIGSRTFEAGTEEVLDLSVAGIWDAVTPTDYTVAANRAGKDFYLFACKPAMGTKPVLMLSDSATGPAGVDAGDAVLIGGFHCLCVAVGAISGHALTDMLAGDILPASIWDLRHRSLGDQDGTVWDAQARVWVDIYLASWDGTRLRSAFGVQPVRGNSNPAFHWYNFAENFITLGKRLPRQNEFMSLSDGSNQGTNIIGSTPRTAGGWTDTAGRRMISHIGVEEACGHYWQWGIECAGQGRGNGWVAENTMATENSLDDVQTLARGSSFGAPHRPRFGGYWNDGAICGSRCAPWIVSPLVLISTSGARGVAEPAQ